MFKWFLFQSTWMLGDSYANVSFIIALYRYILVIFFFYAISYVAVLRIPGSRPRLNSLLLLVIFLIVYCLMMYYLFGYFYRKYPEIPASFKNVYKSMSQHR
jgi:hypothetical protein